MELLQPLVAAVGRAGGRARNKRGLTALGEAVASGHAAAAELLAAQARPRPRDPNPNQKQGTRLPGGRACAPCGCFARAGALKGAALLELRGGGGGQGHGFAAGCAHQVTC